MMKLRPLAVALVVSTAFASAAYGQTARETGRKFLLRKSNSPLRSSERDVLFIFDASASMSKKTQSGERKIDVAKEAFTRMVNRLPSGASGVKVGLMAYGHRIQAGQSGCCGDIELVVPVTPTNKQLLNKTVKTFRPLGKTPIAKSLTLAAQAVRSLNSDRQKMVVLLTDGIETCGGDPKKAAAALQELGIDVDFYVIGFDLSAERVRPIKEIAAAGKGTFLDAKNKKKLDEAFEVVKERIEAPKQPVGSANFFDGFDGTQLARHWKLINRDDDSHIVENGSLMLLSSTPGDLDKGTISNLVKLNRSLPRGDWTMTMQMSTQIQTAQEMIVFGLHHDAKNYVVAKAEFRNYFGVYCHIHATKVANGKKSEVSRNKAWESRTRGTYVEQMKLFPKPFLLRLEKRGRNYTVSFGYPNKEKKTQWAVVGKLTWLRAKGQLILGLHQRAKVAGESSITVDWVKIVRPE